MLDDAEKRELVEACRVLAESLGITLREAMRMSRADLIAGAAAAQARSDQLEARRRDLCELRDLMDRYPVMIAEADTVDEAVSGMSPDDAARFRELNDRLQADAR